MRQGLLDLIAVLALAAFLYGVWQVYHPAAWILGGLLVLGYALQASRASTPTPDGP